MQTNNINYMKSIPRCDFYEILETVQYLEFKITRSYVGDYYILLLLFENQQGNCTFIRRGISFGMLIVSNTCQLFELRIYKHANVASQLSFSKS